MKNVYYHFCVSPLNRKKNQSPLTFLSDRTGEPVQTLVGTNYSPSRSKKADNYEHFIPSHMPNRFNNPFILWKEVEADNLRLDARLGRLIDIAFPYQMSKENRRKSIIDLVQHIFVEDGMAATIFFYETGKYEKNPHVLIMLTAKRWENGRFVNNHKKEFVLNENGERIIKKDKNGNPILRDGNRPVYQQKITHINNWDKKETLYIWREKWEEICNQYLPQGYSCSCKPLVHSAPYVHVGKLWDNNLKQERIRHNNFLKEERKLNENDQRTGSKTPVHISDLLPKIPASQ